jgi:minor extracellular protease Epr
LALPIRIVAIASLLYTVPILGYPLWDGKTAFDIGALAEDDDDDGDDGGDGNAGDSDDDDDDAPRRVQRSAPPPPSLPEAARDQLVVLGLYAAGLAELQRLGYRMLRDDPPSGLALLQLPEGLTVEAALEAVATLLPDTLAAPNSYYRNQAGECDSGICGSWELAGFEPPDPIQCTFAPAIGVVDTGVNLEHEMLRGADITLERFGDEAADPSGLKHGTAVVALLVGDPDGRVPGMAPTAKLRVADPFVTAGGDERADAYGLYLSIASLVAAEVEIINLSLAGPGNRLIEKAVADANAAGVPIVAAVGNAGPRSEPLYPAAYQSVVAVTAVDGGNRVYRRAGQGAHVDFAAPGVGIATAASQRGVRPQTGTSFAVPFVTMALLTAKARLTDAEHAELLAMVAGESVDLGETGRDPVFGDGLVQIGSPC